MKGLLIKGVSERPITTGVSEGCFNTGGANERSYNTGGE